MNEPLTMYANALDAVGLAHPTDTGWVVKLIRSEQYQTSTEYLLARRVKRSARRASFIGSTNSMEFLNDETGSVHWLCFELNGIDWAYSKEVYMDDVYAQAYALFKSGEFDYYLTRAEIAENDTVNQKHTTVSTEQELIQDFLLLGSATEHHKFMPAKDVLIYLMQKVSPSLRINPIMVGKSLKKMGFIRLQQSNGHYQVKGYYVGYYSSS